MEHIIGYKYILYVFRAFRDLFPQDIQLLPQLFQFRFLIFDNGQPHDAYFHHFTQFHQIYIIPALVQNDPVDHRIDHDLVEPVADKCAFRPADLQDPVIDQYLNGFSDRIPAYTEAFCQFHLRRDLIPGFQISRNDRLGDTVYHCLHYGFALDFFEHSIILHD